MKKTIKIIKKMIVAIGALIGIIVMIAVLFVNLSPQFGGKPNEKQKVIFSKSPNYKNGQFINIGGVKNEMSGSDMIKAIGGMFKSIPNAKPNTLLNSNKIDSTNIANYNGKTRFIWFGHSTFLLQMNDKNILIDPMFGEVPAPHPLLGGKRFSKGLPIEIEKLPKIDAVIISHDHYDHLDYNSIKKLKNKVDQFFTPLGVGSHLKEWGVEQNRIIELDWWEQVKIENITFISTPAQHFSGRGLSDRDQTLWCSWIIQSQTENIFFSGDSGYGEHFKEIGDEYGPFDLAMMECGQYNELWPEIHMFPEETAQAGVDIRAKKIMPIHWGAFKLAQHSWTDPIERVIQKAKELKIEVVTPEIGTPTEINQENQLDANWWSRY
ncbi:MBL fold metallo-hydrolase [Tenacibaculum agarivorans]|uniref:MBL fold metallo-hydrolase n=1 Tax=Tenacibaculum agarivorans TaxID=1908389 RepID=UPI001F1DA6B8|nr:MBL fold metallo-hydrolase [Tenacibaculum agarivorans]